MEEVNLIVMFLDFERVLVCMFMIFFVLEDFLLELIDVSDLNV